MIRNILVVDDSVINRKILQRILQDDYHVEEAENGKEALDILRRSGDAFSAVILDLLMPVMDGYETLRHIRSDSQFSNLPVIVATGSTDNEAEVKALSLGANDFLTKPYNPMVIKHRLWNTIHLRETSAYLYSIQRDKLTGLYNRESFFEKAGDMIAVNPPGYFVLACFDVDNFKIINDQYGTEKGDAVLRFLAETFRTDFGAVGGICGRIMADHFAVLYPKSFTQTPEISNLRRKASELDGSIQPISFTIGRYIVDDPTLSVSAMYDRAVIAEMTVKGRFDTKIAFYNESMRESLLQERDITANMDQALAERQFEAWLQPQYNHATGALIGAEALVRWRHPVRGMISPIEFVPVFERNGFIYEMDKYVWEQACIYLRKWMDEGDSPLPLSVNVSRYDIFREDFLVSLTGLVERYQIPTRLLRLEITESAFAKSAEQIIRVVRQLIDYGFTIEIDDFGSGYSSLNTLKDVPAEILKLDMRFLENSENSRRGGNILESIVRMAKWLGMPVIAEGVETAAQADFLKSIGCYLVQGYLYARPMPLPEYEKLLKSSLREEKQSILQTVDRMDNNAFWDPASLETLIFNSYVGGACIFEYYNGTIELLRINDKYAIELGGESLTAEKALSVKLETLMDGDSLLLLKNSIEKAIATGEESTCETGMTGLSNDGSTVFIRSTVRMIAKAQERYLIYGQITNITAQREAEQQIVQADEQLRFLNKTAHDLLTQTDTSQGIQEVLVRVREYFQADRAYVIELDSTRRVSDNTYEACAEGVSSEMAHLQGIPEEATPFWWSILQGDGSINIKNVSDLSADRAEERRILEAQSIRSLIAVPLRRNGQLAGFIGVDNPNRHHSHVGHLQAIGDYLAALLARRDLDAKIAGDNKAFMELMNDTPGGFVRMQMRENGVPVPIYVNAGFCEIVGMTQAEVLHKYRDSALWGVHPADIGVVENAVRDMLQTGQTRGIQYRLRHGTEGYIWVMIFGRMVKNQAGETFFNIYYTDLTEQDKKKLSFREMYPAALAAVMESAAELTFVKDKEFRYVCCSRTFANMLGFSSEKDLMGKTDFDLVDRALAEKFRCEDVRMLTVGEPLLDDVDRLPAKDGFVHYCSTSKYPLRDSFGNIIGIYGNGRDITENRETNSRLKLFTDSLPCGLATYEITPERVRLRYFSDGYSALTGYDREAYQSLAEKDPFGLVWQEDMPGIRRDMEAVFQGKNDFSCCYRARCKDGGCRWMDMRGAVSERRGDTILVNAVKFDITTKKLTENRLQATLGMDAAQPKEPEERLRLSEAELKLILSKMGKMLCTYDVKTHVFTMPEPYKTKHGFAENTLRQPEHAADSQNLDQADREAMTGFFNAILRGDQIGSVECHIQRGDGSRCWENYTFVSIFDGDGNPGKAVITVEDVTEQHEMADESRQLRENERVLQLVAEHSDRFIFRYEIATKTAYTDAAAAARLGLPPREKGVPETWIAQGRILPESVEDFRRIFMQIREGKVAGNAKLRARGADGTPRWADVKYSLLKNGDQTSGIAVLSFRDITEEHERELAYERYLQTIHQAAQDAGTLIYLEGDVTADVAEKHGGARAPKDFPAPGCSRSDTVGYIVKNYLAPEERERCREFFGREHLMTAFADGSRSLSEDWHILYADGAPGYFRSELQLVQDPYTGHIKVYTQLRDITAEKLAVLDMQRQVELDGMTGLYNKTTTEALVEARLARTEHLPCALLVGDLDNLKAINDTLGHDQGDRAIRLIGGALRSQFRQTDIVGRVGGDEFVVFLDNCGGETWLDSVMGSFMKRMAALRVGSQDELPLRGSVGVAFGTTGEDTYAALFKRADRALYHVKRNGKSDFAVYTPDMEQTFYAYQGHPQADGNRGTLVMTMREACILIQELKIVFDVVRLVDAEQMIPYQPVKFGTVEPEEHPCYAVWHRDRRCDNCISIRALREKKRLEKYECVDGRLFSIVSRYAQIDGKDYALEAVSDVTDQALDGTRTLESVCKTVSEWNRKTGLAHCPEAK